MLQPWTGQKLAVSRPGGGECKAEKQRTGKQAPHPPRFPGRGNPELGGRRFADKSSLDLMNLVCDIRDSVAGYKLDDF